MQIGPYQVLLELGRGGMGTVYLGRLVGAGGFERLVAIKRAHASALDQQDAAERFLREARLAASVHHANVVGIHQIGEDQDGQYLACDYVEGEALDRLIERGGRPEPLPVGIALRIVLDALAGLHAAHETVDSAGKPLGILHRDVSIENLLVGRDGVTRLTDFGIAKSSVGPRLTGAGIIHGKLLYLTPEYLQGEPSQRSDDTYAMGVTLWIALAGAFPYRGRDNQALMREVLQQPISRLSAVGAGGGPLLDACVARALSREPGVRFQTARQMLEALDDVATRETPAARHLDVADFVEQAAGQRLTQRREKLQASRAAQEAGAALPPPPLRVTPTLDITQQDVAIAKPWRHVRLRLMLAGVLFIVATFVVLWSNALHGGGARRDVSAPTRTEKPVVASPARQTSTPNASVPSVPRSSVMPVVTPLDADDRTASMQAEDAAAPKPLPARRDHRPTAPRHAASPTDTRPPPAAPLGITTDNPYR